MAKDNKFSLIVKPVKAGDVRRGWVRVHELDRGDIKSDSLVRIKNNQTGKTVTRIMLGLMREPRQNYIKMDENTRLALGIKDNQVGSTMEFTIQPYSKLRSYAYASALFYLNHPEFPLRFSTRIAMILGAISVVLGTISIAITI